MNIRGAARYFIVKERTSDNYLGFGGEYVRITNVPDYKLYCIGEEDATYQVNRIAMTESCGRTIYNNIDDAILAMIELQTYDNQFTGRVG